MARKTIVLVDGDVLAFRASAGIEERSINVLHLPSGKEKVFTNRTELKARLREKFPEDWKVKLQEYEVQDVQTAEDASYACHIVKQRLKKLKEIFDADAVEVYLDGGNNFRERLPLPKKYKGNRVDRLRPLHLEAVKEYMRKIQGAVSVDGVETDDVVNIRAYQELRKGNRAIIASNDKDTLQSEGVIFYDYTKDSPTAFLIPDLGGLHKEANEVKGAGLKFFAFQLLFGDTVDNYSPTDVCGVRYGKTSAFNDLVDLVDAQAILSKVVEKYKEWYPEPVTFKSWTGATITANWEDMLELYFKCAYMQRDWDDKTTWKEFFTQRGWKDDSNSGLSVASDSQCSQDSGELVDASAASPDEKN